MKKKTTVRRRRRSASVGAISIPKKITTKHLTGAGLGIAGETLVDKVSGGVLTDQTGRYLKIGAGLFLLLTQKNQTVQGVGLGVAVNNAYANFVSKENKTLGDTVADMVLPAGSVAGRYDYNYLKQGGSQANGLGSRRVVYGRN